MRKIAFLVLLLLLTAAGLSCGRSGSLQDSQAISTAAALAPTLQAGATALVEAGDAIAPTLEAPATESAPTAVTEAGQLIATQAVPTAEATQAPPSPLTPEPATPPGGTGEFLPQMTGSQGLSGLASYRQSATLDFVGGGQSGRVDYWGEFTASPQATHGRVTLSGLAAAGLPLPAFEYIIIEGETWVKVGRFQWQAVPGGTQQVTGQQPYSAETFLFAWPAAQRVLPDEVVNDTPCKRFVYQTTNLVFQGGSLDTASGEVCTAVEGGYVVRYTLNGTGRMDAFFAGQTGTINLVYNVLDVNASFEILPPR